MRHLQEAEIFTIKRVCSDPDQRYTPKYGDSGNDPSVDGARHLNG